MLWFFFWKWKKTKLWYFLLGCDVFQYVVFPSSGLAREFGDENVFVNKVFGRIYKTVALKECIFMNEEISGDKDAINMRMFPESNCINMIFCPFNLTIYSIVWAAKNEFKKF